MSNTSTSALGRSYRAERALITVVGVLALLIGVAIVVVGLGWLGTYRAARPLIDPIAVDWIAGRQLLARVVAIVLGLVLLVLGLLWFFRSLRPESRPDLELDENVGARLTVTAGAIAEAVRLDAERVDGVGRARVRVVGGGSGDPALRLSLWLREGSDVRAVWQELDEKVLSRARASLGVSTLPTAVRLELAATQRQRVR